MIFSVKKLFVKKEVFIFLSIVLLATILRFYQLGSNPISLDWDEASMGYNAYSLLKTGADEYGNKLPLEIRSFDDYKPPVYTYLAVPSVAVFGLTSFAVRLPAAIFGVIAVAVVFFLTKELLHDFPESVTGRKIKKYAPYIASFFLAVSPWHLQFSRAAFEGNIGVCFFSIALLLLLKGFRKGYWFILSSIFFILSMYSYHSFRLITPLFFIIALVIFWKKLLQKKWYVLSGFVLLVFLALPIYISFINPAEGSHARLSMVTIFGNSEFLQPSIAKLEKSRIQHDTVGMILNNRRIVYTTAIMRGYFDHFTLNFLFLNGDGGRQHHAVHMGMMYLWDLPFLLIGIFYILKNRNKRLALPLLLILLAPLPSSVTTGTPHPVRAIGMIPFLQIITAIGFSWVVVSFWQKKNSIFKYLLPIIFIILFIGNFVYYLHQYYVVTPKMYASFWQYGYQQVFTKVSSMDNKYDKVIVTYYYDQPYIYYLFFNKIDPAWYQKHWDINMNGRLDRMYRVIGKYEFRNIDWNKDSQRKKTILVAAPSEVPSDVQSIENITFPDSKIAFRIIAL